jgi:hypothetical protein
MKIALPIYILFSLGTALSPEFSAATPIPESSIPDSIDWFAHLDADQLRQSRAGATLLNELTSLDPLKENTQMPINPVLLINGLKGITAFGTMPDLKNPGSDVDVVTVVSGTPELLQIVKGLVSGMQLEQPEAIEEIAHGDHSILSMKQAGICGVFLEEDKIAMSKSMDSMDRFLSVGQGGIPHLQFGQRFPAPVDATGLGVYFGAFVEGISGFENLPAQARVLQLTKAVAVQLGESDDNLHLLTSLVTKDPQTAQQVSSVLQGIIAMFILTQNGHPDVATLVDSARVKQAGNAVTLKVDYPATSAEKWIGVMVELMRQKMTEKASPEEAPAAEESPSEVADASAAPDAAGPESTEEPTPAG